MCENTYLPSTPLILERSLLIIIIIIISLFKGSWVSPARPYAESSSWFPCVSCFPCLQANAEMVPKFPSRSLLTGTADSHPPEYVIPDDVLIQFGPPDDEHLLLEICRGVNKYIKKECIKLVINQNCIKMHGQQNIKFATTCFSCSPPYLNLLVTYFTFV
jgi:hypothetical protein